MSRLTELLAQVAKTDPALARDLRREVDVLSSRRTFGLNFERHVPESVQLPNRKIRRGDKVLFRDADNHQRETWVVVGFEGTGAERKARLARRAPSDRPETTTVPVGGLVVVAEFRDPIFPGLRSSDSVQRGGDKPFHAVINGENYHVLQALSFVCRGQVDCIYIDPPYNSGARDWKYNNDYVDAEDAYRHSKWLAMMERRLLAARELLNPAGSVLIATIDEKEVNRLGLLLDQVFSGVNRQVVTSVVNRKGVPRKREFARVEEYLFFVFIGDSGPELHSTDMLSNPRPTVEDKVEWVGLRRRGSEWRRQDRPGSFYPIFVDEQSGQVQAVGESLPLGTDRTTVPERNGLRTVWPLNRNGAESRWQLAAEKVLELVAAGCLRSYLQRVGGVTIEYLSDGQRQQIEEGAILITGRDPNGTVIVKHAAGKRQQPKSVWNLDSHGATAYGTQMVSALLPGRRFPYPKSLYAVEDSLRLFVGSKRDALVLDFFAGSGTTAHAVMRLNRQDGGRRRCILVTNNEVSAEEAAMLRASGYAPGDPGWESLGICEHITKPRIRAALTGLTPEREPIKGDYKFRDEFPIAAGFEENAEFFDLTYEDAELLRYGLGFEAIAPLLWLRAGSEGGRINAANGPFAVAGSYAVLFDLDGAAGFVSAVRAKPELRIAYIVTDDETQFQVVAGQLPHSLESIRLYAAYLDNFRIQSGA
jgi:adenine-specific DNA-methyltransferase